MIDYLDDLEMLQVRILSECRLVTDRLAIRNRVISQIWEATTAKRVKVDAHCQRHKPTRIKCTKFQRYTCGLR